MGKPVKQCNRGASAETTPASNQTANDRAATSVVGYSGTPLAKKLGIKAGHRVGLFDAPTSPTRFEGLLEGLPDGVTLVRDRARKAGPRFDVIVSFHHSQKDFLEAFAARAAALEPTGGLWFAWPKKASGVKTDLTETVIRETALAAGLVDNKVCAIDSVWSGLRIVVRVKDRPKGADSQGSAKRVRQQSLK